MSDGSGFLAQVGLGFIQQNTDYVVVGRVLGATQLGYYSMAYRLGELQYEAVVNPIATVTFPVFARRRARGEDVAKPFLRVLRAASLVTVPFGVLVSGTAPQLVATVYGPKWDAAVVPVTIFGIWAAVRGIQATVGWLLNSVGKARLGARVSAIQLVALIPGVIAAAELSGIVAVAAVMLADITLALVLLARYANNTGEVTYHQMWSALRPIVLAAPAAWIGARGSIDLLSGAPAPAALAAGVVVGGGGFFLLTLVTAPDLWADIRQVILGLMRRPASSGA
jgi:PST family polysaccharide transporter